VKPVVRVGLVAPAVIVLVAAVVWGIAGPGWGAGALVAGGAALLATHLHHLGRLTEWAAGPLDAPVPEGRGIWAPIFSAIYRRVRIRAAYERDLKLTIERFRRAAEAIPDGVLLLDETNRIEWANPRALAQFRLDLESDRGSPIANFVRAPEFLRYLEQGDYSESVRVDSPEVTGATFSLQLVPYGVREKLLLSRDITEIEAVARMRRDFIANASHELKTPLTVVTGFLETMQDMRLEPEQQSRYLRLMQEQAKNMQRLVDDLLTLSALESEDSAQTEARFAVAPLLQEIVAEGRILSGGAHAIALDVAAGAGDATVQGARDELASALRNLVSNAIRYTPDGGTITLAWRRADDGGGEFRVVDTGIGIAPEHIPRLTERFYRVDRSRSRATGGTGLGLAIVKHVLLRHQAELDVMSEPGKGSIFSVRLPARRVEWMSEGATQGAPVTNS
jgi:two-component system phosphate regulon sensor histidine kinase PhoR